MRRCSAEPGGRQLTWKMQVSLAASSVFLLGLFTSIGGSLSLEEDWESSGLDLEFSGSGDGSEQNHTDDVKSFNGRTLAEGRNHNFHASSDRNIFKMPVSESEFVILGSHKSFLQNSETLAGVIVGGVAGLILAVAATAFLIYRFHMKDNDCILGKLSEVV